MTTILFVTPDEATRIAMKPLINAATRQEDNDGTWNVFVVTPTLQPTGIMTPQKENGVTQLVGTASMCAELLPEEIHLVVTTDDKTGASIRDYYSNVGARLVLFAPHMQHKPTKNTYRDVPFPFDAMMSLSPISPDHWVIGTWADMGVRHYLAPTEALECLASIEGAPLPVSCAQR